MQRKPFQHLPLPPVETRSIWEDYKPCHKIEYINNLLSGREDGRRPALAGAGGRPAAHRSLGLGGDWRLAWRAGVQPSGDLRYCAAGRRRAEESHGRTGGRGGGAWWREGVGVRVSLLFFSAASACLRLLGLGRSMPIACSWVGRGGPLRVCHGIPWPPFGSASGYMWLIINIPTCLMYYYKKYTMDKWFIFILLMPIFKRILLFVKIDNLYGTRY
jgi:hypothetical protein